MCLQIEWTIQANGVNSFRRCHNDITIPLNVGKSNLAVVCVNGGCHPPKQQVHLRPVTPSWRLLHFISSLASLTIRRIPTGSKGWNKGQGVPESPAISH